MYISVYPAEDVMPDVAGYPLTFALQIPSHFTADLILTEHFAVTNLRVVRKDCVAPVPLDSLTKSKN